MIKKISYFIYKVLFFLDKLFFLIIKRSILVWFKEFLISDSYKEILILDSKIKFFIPNHLTEWRVNTFFSKEPETIEWINSFKVKDNLIFWDVGANIGLYSIYNALKHKNSQTISFEPSTSNLRVLSRNISINNLENRIKIFPIALSNVKNMFLTMKEGDFIEGGALSSFGVDYDYQGKNFSAKMKYKLFGTNIDYLIENNFLEIPDYIKIDVDGIEHLILEGGSNHLKNKKIKSISIEINEDFNKQLEKVSHFMSNNFVRFCTIRHPNFGMHCL